MVLAEKQFPFFTAFVAFMPADRIGLPGMRPGQERQKKDQECQEQYSHWPSLTHQLARVKPRQKPINAVFFLDNTSP
jgi:hypothetical protein